MAIDRRPSEFAGRPGMVQDEQIGHETEIQEVWEMYATNPASSDPIDPKKVGEPGGQKR